MKTVIFDARLITVTDSDGVERDVPDVGATMAPLMRRTGPGIWTGSDTTYALTVKALADLTGGPNPRVLYNGQCNEATFALLEAELGAAQVQSGKAGWQDAGRRAEMFGLAKRVRRVSDSEIVAFQAAHVIAGEDQIASSLNPCDDPADFEDSGLAD